MGELCALAILKTLAGEDGQSLGRSILPFASFPSLWCSESAYHPQEAKKATSRLLCAFGRESPDPADALPKMSEEGPVSQARAHSLDFGGSIQNAFVLVGDKVPLGAMRSGLIEIPSFGPQVHPLNDPHLFGVHRKIADPRWSAVSARPEIWFEYFALPHQSSLEIRFFGLTPEAPVSFVFYVKAKQAKIDNEVYLSKSLHRYCKESKKVIFESGESRFSIENTCPFKMELIPLAGGGCFWDSDFLLGFEIPVHDGRAVFQFR